jgi:iron complex outermembrane receptor protein
VIVGNPALVPETGAAGDLGLVVAPGRRLGPLDRLFLEAAFFAARPRDLIALLPTAGRVARAANLGAARIAGHELALSARLWRTVTVTGNYTFLDSAQRSPLLSYDGKRLPGRPRHEAYLRVDVARRLGAGRRHEVGAWADATLISGNYLDAGNTRQVPARRLLALGVRGAPRPGLVLSLEAKNLLDETVEDVALGREVRPGLSSTPRAVADVLGYPLPGRALYGTAEWTF